MRTFSTSTFTVSFATLTVLGLIVACSPNSGQAPIKPAEATGFQKSVGACADKLKSSEKLKYNKAQNVNICENPVLANGKFDTKSVPTLMPVSFTVQKGTDDSKNDSKETNRSTRAIQVAMKIGFTTSEKLTDDVKRDWVQFSGLCRNDIETIFSSSNFGTAVGLTLSADFELMNEEFYSFTATQGTDPLEEPDQTIHVSQGTEGGDSFWVLDQLPSRPRFYPRGKEADVKECRAQKETPSRDCLIARRRAANISVCAAVAKRIGNGLGIVDYASEERTCGALPVDGPKAVSVATAEQASAKPLPDSSGDSSFAKPSTNDQEYLEKARLNRKDLVTILSLPCPDLKNSDLK